MVKVDFRNEGKEQSDEQYSPYSENARDLYRQENDTGSDAQNESASPSTTSDGEPSKTSNIDDTRQQEEENSGWETNVSGGEGKNSGKKEPTTFWQQAKKKGPMAAILTLVGGGGLIGGGLLSPAGALIHIKEILVNKFDTISSIMDDRSTLIIYKRFFGTNTTCKIKVRCRFSGATTKQMDALRAQGADIVDKNGKPIKKNAFGRYSGGTHLVMPDGKTKISAKDFKKAMKNNPDLRALARIVVTSPHSTWNGPNSKDIRAKKRLVTNPEWGDGDEKDSRKSVFKAVSGEGYTAENQDASNSEKYETDENGDVKKDKDGNPIPKAGAQELGDMGDFADAINEEGDKLKTAAANGDLIDEIPSDPAGAANMAESKIGSSVAKKAIGFLNPLDILTGLCGAYKVTKTIVYAARAYVIVNAMRYASQFLSTADKLKAGEATSTDAEQAMNILQKTDQYGDSFGDATGYQYAEYGTVPDKPLGFSATGNSVVLVLSAVLQWLNSHIGRSVLKTGCNIATNPFFQGAMALTSFIPGGGQITGAITKVIGKSAEAAAKATIKSMIEKMAKAAVKKATESLTKDAVKNAAKVAGKEFLKLAAGAGGIFLSQYLLARYAVPYLARISSDTILNGNESGPTAMDTMAGGFDATNQVTAQQTGMVPLTKQQATAFKEFNDSYTATYVADMRAQSNPFDVYDPYSASNSLATIAYNFTSKLSQSSLLTAPATILSSLNLGNLLSSTTNADTIAFGDDTYLNAKNIATSPFNTAVMGFNDIGMLETADPDTDVTMWMLDHKQIDDDGNPVDGSNWAKFKEMCVNDKVIADPDVVEGALDPDCTDPDKNNTTERKMFHLYQIDGGGVDNMDAEDTSSNTQDAATTTKYIAVGGIPETGLIVGASVFGGKQSGGKWVENLADNGGNDLGNHGNHMTGTPAIAELDMGKALGGIPDGTRVEIDYNGKKVIAIKDDIGAGGPNVDGHKRAVDLWWQTANALGFNDGTGVITIHAVDPGTELTPVASIGNNTSKNIGFSLGNILPLTSYNIFSPFIKGQAL